MGKTDVTAGPGRRPFPSRVTPFQVEVDDPDPAKALDLVTSGQIQPVP
jgi:hypothetical protein